MVLSLVSNLHSQKDPTLNKTIKFMIIHWLILSQRDKVLGSEMPWIRSRQTCFFLKGLESRQNLFLS